ncbi:hypothetical protein ACFRCG_41780 [Embleya sp. NPDC056575]|uniref:hypothetical protein n=1 Tax=unclassified Embleya TaxID=2699296 RepID=UPI0036C482B8
MSDDSIANVLPEGHIALGYAVSIKALDEHGDVCLINYRTHDLNAWEALGMHTSAADDIRRCMQEREGDG